MDVVKVVYYLYLTSLITTFLLSINTPNLFDIRIKRTLRNKELFNKKILTRLDLKC